jgi:flagellar basal body P-ring protein FlgI
VWILLARHAESQGARAGMKPYATILWGGLALAAGCAGPSVRSQSPEELGAVAADARLLGEYCVPHQMHALTVEAVALVTGLPGTGGDPPASPQRARLLEEMKTRGVKDPNRVLASPDTSLVLVRGYLRPGIQKGDTFDVEIRTPGQTETTSLSGGWLMETRLQELAVLDNQVREGSVKALARGPLLVDPANSRSGDEVSRNRARILGGGVSMISRPVALVVKPDYKSVHYSSQIAVAINKRFSIFEQGIKTGVANAKDDQFIELVVHPRYKDNLERYLRVVRALPLRESTSERVSRIALLERQLLDPVTSATAAIRLEALGREGIESLKKGLAATDQEVRFYAAEALAYLDESAAAEPLAQAARQEPAFRVFALAALGAMDDVAAYDQLRTLLDVNSAETRYGAFRALWAMNANDPLVKGEAFDGRFSYHVLDTSGPALIHATRSYRPELVLFGADQRFKTPLILEAGPHIQITTHEGDEVTVSRFAVGEPDQKRVVNPSVDAVIRAVVDLGGTYPDVVQLLQQAKDSNALDSRFEVDALPEAGRMYHRQIADESGEALPEDDSEEVSNADDATEDGIVPETALPDLYSRKSVDDDDGEAGIEQAEDGVADGNQQSRPMRSFFARIRGQGDD